MAAGESAFIQFYQKYAVFSWPWAWRRTAIFGSIGALAGISFGVSHGLHGGTSWEAIELSLVVQRCQLALVGAGPVLGAFFRHRGWPQRVERVWVVAAVICGMVLGTLADQFAVQFHDRLMARHGLDSSMDDVAADGRALDRAARPGDEQRSADPVRGQRRTCAVQAYFSEKRRWAAHLQARRAGEVLGQQKSEADLRLTGAAGTGRAAFSFQHAGLGAFAGWCRTGARRTDDRRARGAFARDHAEDALRQPARRRPRSGSRSRSARAISSS